MKDTMLTVKKEVVIKEGIGGHNFMCQWKKKELFRNYSSMQDSS